MDGIPTLVPNSQLQTRLLKEAAEQHKLDISLHYDPDFDALTILVVLTDDEIVAHYVDGNVALLYQDQDYEVIGLQIEAFERSFLPVHDVVRQVWRLNDNTLPLKNLGDMLLRVEQLTPEIARAVAEATKATLGQPGIELAAALT